MTFDGKPPDGVFGIHSIQLSSHCWKYLIVLEFQGRKIEGNRECPANAISYDLTTWGRYLRGVPFFSVKHRRAVAEFTLLFSSNHTHSDALTLILRVFPPRFLCLLLRLEWLRQRGEHTPDILEEQPLLNDFRHGVL